MKNRFLLQEYKARINRAIDYIERNIGGDLSLANLSSVAGFSPFHFHRIFAGMMGETLNRFIQRVRVEKAAMMLVSNPRKNMTEIAFDCGYSGSAQFSRAFRERFGTSPSEWRRSQIAEESKICKNKSNGDINEGNNGKDAVHVYGYDEGNMPERLKMNSVKPESVEVKKFHDRTVAYVRHVGPYKGDPDLFEKLINRICSWAGSRELLKDDTELISVYHDNPEVTDAGKLRVSVCITVPDDARVDSEIGKMKIEGGAYVVAHFKIDPDEYEDAWDWVYGTWLPESGYQPDDRPCFELYGPDPKEHPQGKHIVDICVPVTPL
ncbi:MAG TPA: GyrI-like domain-containing protein [Spirochaetota bacterium]|nr:GyrI-like domain-containing protein [Spirochaetota bacterium]HPJ34332.1 GyrI-like domain-containing protein [Spirochaetota bacterium]